MKREQKGGRPGGRQIAAKPRVSAHPHARVHGSRVLILGKVSFVGGFHPSVSSTI